MIPTALVNSSIYSFQSLVRDHTIASHGKVIFNRIHQRTFECTHVIFSTLNPSWAIVLSFFLKYFTPDKMLSFKARKIPEIEVPFGMSPNSFKPS